MRRAQNAEMSRDQSRSLVLWRWVFLTLETFVVGALALALVVEPVFGRRGDLDLGIWTIPFAVVFGVSLLFLLIVSPFFLRSLRAVALAGWLIAFGMLLLGMILPV